MSPVRHKLNRAQRAVLIANLITWIPTIILLIWAGRG